MRNQKIFLLYASALFIVSKYSIAQSFPENCPDPSAYNCGIEGENGFGQNIAALETVVIVGLVAAVAVAGVYYLMPDNEDENYRSAKNVLAQYKQGMGIRLTGFDTSFDVSLFLLHQQDPRNNYDVLSQREYLGAKIASTNHISVTLVNISIRW